MVGVGGVVTLQHKLEDIKHAGNANIIFNCAWKLNYVHFIYPRIVGKLSNCSLSDMRKVQRFPNLTNFHKYTRFTTIVETIKFDWNNQTNQYNAHVELFLDLQKVINQLCYGCVYLFSRFIWIGLNMISAQKIAVILPGIFHNQKKLPRPWVARSRLLSCLSAYCK